MTIPTHQTEILVVGSGIAGLTFALKAAEHGRVLLLTKKERAASNTNRARGGIAAAMGSDDTFDLHVRDTLLAGAGLCHRPVVEAVVREGPERVRELIAWGARFAHDGAGFRLGMEGGHSRRRILHAGDRTGQEIERALIEAAEGDPRIEILEDHFVTDLRVAGEEGSEDRRCVGAAAVHEVTGRPLTIEALVTFLATGGCGQVYLHTTNPRIATGDGVAMAFRAGARVANMEFVQFHPTALFPTEDPAFLISEAVRGEGAELVDAAGRPFMRDYHPAGALAPRDVVARAIDRELKEHGGTHVRLDLSAIPRATFESRFPDTVGGCRERGIDPFEDGIPVVPAAHYACGGIWTDLQGRSSLPGLLAAGEVACTGVHGANRLASNSLLEAVVLSHRAASIVPDEIDAGVEWVGASGKGNVVSGTADSGRPPEGPASATAGATSAGGEAREESSPAPDPRASDLEAIRLELRTLMWEDAGIVRGMARLRAAVAELEGIAARIPPPEPEDLLERAQLVNLVEVALMIVRSARTRPESRGLHFMEDHPHKDNEACLADTFLERGDRSGGLRRSSGRRGAR